MRTQLVLRNSLLIVQSTCNMQQCETMDGLCRWATHLHRNSLKWDSRVCVPPPPIAQNMLPPAQTGNWCPGNPGQQGWVLTLNLRFSPTSLGRKGCNSWWLEQAFNFQNYEKEAELWQLVRHHIAFYSIQSPLQGSSWQNCVNQELRQEQAGFRRGIWCTDQIFTLKTLLRSKLSGKINISIPVNNFIAERALSAAS